MEDMKLSKFYYANCITVPNDYDIRDVQEHFMDNGICVINDAGQLKVTSGEVTPQKPIWVDEFFIHQGRLDDDKGDKVYDLCRIIDCRYVTYAAYLDNPHAKQALRDYDNQHGGLLYCHPIMFLKERIEAEFGT